MPILWIATPSTFRPSPQPTCSWFKLTPTSWPSNQTCRMCHYEFRLATSTSVEILKSMNFTKSRTFPPPRLPRSRLKTACFASIVEGVLESLRSNPTLDSSGASIHSVRSSHSTMESSTIKTHKSSLSSTKWIRTIPMGLAMSAALRSWLWVRYPFIHATRTQPTTTSLHKFYRQTS